MFEQGMIVIEKPHRGNWSYWHAFEEAEFVEKVIADFGQKRRQYELDWNFEQAREALAYDLRALEIVRFQDFKEKNDLQLLELAKYLDWF